MVTLLRRFSRARSLLGMGFRSPRAAAEFYNASRRCGDLFVTAVKSQSCCRISRRWQSGDHSHSHSQHHLAGKEGDRVFKLGLAADVALSAGKSVAGYLSGSTAVIADAAHSISDIVSLSYDRWSASSSCTDLKERLEFNFTEVPYFKILCHIVILFLGMAKFDTTSIEVFLTFTLR